MERTPHISNRRTIAGRIPVILITILAMSSALMMIGGAPPDQSSDELPGDVVRGWKVFSGKQCIQCHAVWSLGGKVGPDLGRTQDRGLAAGQLAGTLWNHIPKMYSYMQRNRMEYPRLTLEEMRDLFGFLYFLRQLDAPGDPVVGERVLRKKGCIRCHLTEDGSEPIGPDLRRWGGGVNPIVWAQKMWEHAPRMERAMRQVGITWSKLDDHDLVDIMAYVRQVGRGEAKIYLRPGSARTGARLFAERKCQSCHYPGGIGKDLATAALPQSLAALASRMWNHSPEMTLAMQQRGIERSPLSPQDMADIIAYVFSLRYAERGGDPQKGREIFREKHCADCHAEQATAAGPAPSLGKLSTAATPVRLAHAMWNHGTAMMDRMSAAGIAWPVLQSHEVVDLVAYLRSTAPPSTTGRPEPVGTLSPSATVPDIAVVARVHPPAIEPGESCATNACHPRIIAERVLHRPTAQGECDTCHALLNAQTHEFALASNRSDLCYRCHDEPDDEADDTMQARKTIALGVCTACHDPHGADNLFGPSFTGNEVCFLNMPRLATELTALVNHDRIVAPAAQPAPSQPIAPSLHDAGDPTADPERGGRETISEVVQPSRPDLIAAEPDDDAAAAATELPIADIIPTEGLIREYKTTRPIVATEDGCVSADCHSSTIAEKFVHGPTGQEQCDVCHRVLDEAEHRFELTASEPDLCFECHERPPQAAYTHGPVALGLCSACHDPHSSPNKFMLPEPGPQLCFVCHSQMEEHVLSAGVQHEAINENGCVTCHDPHMADLKFQLKSDLPDLCLDCHEPVRSTIAAATVGHDPVSTGKTCVNCHNPHGSDVQKILVDTEMNICLSCHDQTMDTPNGPIIDMKSWIQDNPERHGPIRNSSCTDCHQPHGSQNFRILRYEFPKEFYRPFSLETYDLCFQCHEETLVLDENTTTLTQFRNGDVNLHYLHVNREKGRTCRACHEIHAGTKPKRIKDFVPFGKWKYPVNFAITEFGGSCHPGCHVKRVYDRREEIIQK